MTYISPMAREEEEVDSVRNDLKLTEASRHNGTKIEMTFREEWRFVKLEFRFNAHYHRSDQS